MIAALKDPEQRKRLAAMVVWGTEADTRRFDRFRIERRVEALLERIATGSGTLPDESGKARQAGTEAASCPPIFQGGELDGNDAE